MIILQESNTSQTFKIIPRYFTADSMVITDESTGASTTYNITVTQTDYYTVITETLSLIEGRTYTLKVYDGTDVIYYDKIFCTNQTTSSYSVNNGEYTTNSSDNEFIFIS